MIFVGIQYGDQMEAFVFAVRSGFRPGSEYAFSTASCFWSSMPLPRFLVCLFLLSFPRGQPSYHWPGFWPATLLSTFGLAGGCGRTGDCLNLAALGASAFDSQLGLIWIGFEGFAKINFSTCSARSRLAPAVTTVCPQCSMPSRGLFYCGRDRFLPRGICLCGLSSTLAAIADRQERLSLPVFLPLIAPGPSWRFWVIPAPLLIRVINRALTSPSNFLRKPKP